MTKQVRVNINMESGPEEAQPKDPNWPTMLEKDEPGINTLAIEFYDAMTVKSGESWIDLSEADDNPVVLTDTQYCSLDNCGHYVWNPWSLTHKYWINEPKTSGALIEREYAATNALRWQRKPLALVTVADSGQRWTYGNTSSKQQVNLLIELKSRGGRVQFSLGPTVENLSYAPPVGRKLKVKNNNTDAAKAFMAKRTSGGPAKHHLAVREIGTKSFAHWIKKLSATEVVVTHDFIEPEGVFWMPFDTSDTTNFVVTSTPKYSLDEGCSVKNVVTGPVLDVFMLGKAQVFLMPRRVAYYLRHLVGKYEQADIHHAYAYNCECFGAIPPESPGVCSQTGEAYCDQVVGDCLNVTENVLYQIYQVFLTDCSGSETLNYRRQSTGDYWGCGTGLVTYSYGYLNPAAPIYKPDDAELKPRCTRTEISHSKDFQIWQACESQFEEKSTNISRVYTKFNSWFCTAEQHVGICYDRWPHGYTMGTPGNETVQNVVRIFTRGEGGGWEIVQPTFKEDETKIGAETMVETFAPISGYNSMHVIEGIGDDLFFQYYNEGATPDLIYLPIVPETKATDCKHPFSSRSEWYLNWPPPFVHTEIWSKLMGTSMGQKIGLGGSQITSGLAHMELAYGVGLVPAQVGQLVAVIKCKSKSFWVWRKTTETFHLNETGTYKAEMCFEDQRSAHMPYDNDLSRMIPAYRRQTTSQTQDRVLDHAFSPRCTLEGQALRPCDQGFAFIGCRIKDANLDANYELPAPIYVAIASPLLHYEEDALKWVGEKWTVPGA